MSDTRYYTTRPTAITIDIDAMSVGSDASGQLKTGSWCLGGPCVAASLGYNRYRSTSTIRVHRRTKSKVLQCYLDYYTPRVAADDETSRVRVKPTSSVIMDGISQDVNSGLSYEPGEHHRPEYEDLSLLLVAI
jgi:hypothetical protein